MIAAHPLLGHGPGSSRVASAAFVSASDQWGPDFMHNTFLQTAVEQGLPAGSLYAVLVLLPLALALRRWKSVQSDPVAIGAFFALIAYLITQLTSNSLNFYIDQQFFFWSLSAVLLLRLRPGGMAAVTPGDATGTGTAQAF